MHNIWCHAYCMKLLLFILLLLFLPLLALSQPPNVMHAGDSITIVKDTIPVKPNTPSAPKQTSSAKPTSPSNQPIQTKKAELFNSGFIDFQNSGQMNASAYLFTNSPLIIR